MHISSASEGGLAVGGGVGPPGLGDVNHHHHHCQAVGVGHPGGGGGAGGGRQQGLESQVERLKEQNRWVHCPSDHSVAWLVLQCQTPC